MRHSGRITESHIGACVQIAINQENKMKIFENGLEWHVDMNDTISQVLCKAYPLDWEDEDYLTRSILLEIINKYKNVQILSGKNIKFSWDLFKNTEQDGIDPKHGNIGVLVQILFEKGKKLEGAAFLNANRIHEPSQRFDELSFSKIEHSACHRTIFYDFNKCESGGGALSLGLPTQHLTAIADNSRSLYPYCEPYSYILTNRYMQGYELDYDLDVVSDLKGLSGENGGVDYLIVAQTSGDPYMSLDINSIELNHDIYEKLSSEESDHTLDGGLTV